jgi:phage terminase large subunit-like protein
VTALLAAPRSELETRRKIAKFRRLLAHRWYCDTRNCDGLPHTGFPHHHARASQHVPKSPIVFYRQGRGAGKTRTAAEFCKHRMLAEAGHRVNIVAPSFNTGFEICMRGVSGMVGSNPGEGVLPAEAIKKFDLSTGRLELHNGSIAMLHSAATAESVEKIRGSASATLWIEELGAMANADSAWNVGLPANRIGHDPRVIITSTPKPTPLVKRLHKLPNVVVVSGHTLDNRANLAEVTVDFLLDQWAGTRLGAQELSGELLDEVAGAQFDYSWFKRIEVDGKSAEEIQDGIIAFAKTLDRVGVVVDPPGSHRGKNNSLAGISVAGIKGKQVFVLADLSCQATPEQWATVVLDAYDTYGCDFVGAEANFGGDMVAATLRGTGRQVPFKLIHASRGKALRAEPVALLYQQGKVFHVGPEARYTALEGQCCEWVPPGRVEVDEYGVQFPLAASPYSPDRMDALVHLISELALAPRRPRSVMVMPE